MRIIHTIRLLLILAFITQENTSFGMNIATTLAKTAINGACSLTELFVTSSPIIDTILNKPSVQPREKLTDTQSIAPEIITNYITQLATEFDIKDIKVIIDTKGYAYSKDAYNPIVYITPQFANELESLLKNNDRSREEEKQFNVHTGHIYHELTHELRDSEHRFRIYKAVKSTIGATIVSSALSHIIKKNMPSIQKSLITKNSFKIGRAALTFSLASHLMHQKVSYLDNLYAHYEEMQADNGIPNKRELLEPLATLYENYHTTELKYIEEVKTLSRYSDIISPPKEYNCNRFELLAMKTIPINWFNNPYLMSATLYAKDTHPSYVQRALHLRKRIKELDQLEALE